jgi:hypothetical protein
MKGDWRQARNLGKLKRGLPDLVRERLIGAGAEEKVHAAHELWQFVLEEGSSGATIILYKTGTCVRFGYAPAADSAEDLVLKTIQEDEIQRGPDEPVIPSGKKQKWYAIAEPIRGVYDDYERCLQLAGSVGRLCGCGPVEVSSKEEGWAILNGGIRLDPGRYAFTDASIVSRESVGIAAVIVEMLRQEGEPACRLENALSESEAVERMEVRGVASGELMGAFRRWKHIFGEMLALYMALQEVVRLPKVPAWPKLTVVHDYVGVYAWMRAGRPQGASCEFVRGFSDAAEGAERWRPPKDAVEKVVLACWRLAMENNLLLAFRHQPGHRSEAAGVHHYARFNRRADELAFETARL